ncbi:hypothetical protein PGB90_005651 [Kerria lacca]
MSEDNRMPKVDFEKDKINQYLIDQIKVVEKDNLKRFAEFKRRLFSGRLSLTTLSTIVVSIYVYTMYTVKRETFLDNFDEPTLDED